MTPEQRSARARLAVNSRWMRPTARREQSEAARNAIERRFERQVDPDGTLPPDLRATLVESAKKAHSARLHMAKARKVAETTKAASSAALDLAGATHAHTPSATNQRRDQHDSR